MEMAPNAAESRNTTSEALFGVWVRLSILLSQSEKGAPYRASTQKICGSRPGTVQDEAVRLYYTITTKLKFGAYTGHTAPKLRYDIECK